MIAEFFSLLPIWMIPVPPMMTPIGVYHMTKGEEEEPTVTVEVNKPREGQVRVTVAPAVVTPPPPDDDQTPRESLLDERDSYSDEATGIRNMRVARMGVDKACEKLDQTTNRLKRKSAEMQAVVLEAERKDKELQCLSSDSRLSRCRLRSSGARPLRPAMRARRRR